MSQTHCDVSGKEVFCFCVFGVVDRDVARLRHLWKGVCFPFQFCKPNQDAGRAPPPRILLGVSRARFARPIHWSPHSPRPRAQYIGCGGAGNAGSARVFGVGTQIISVSRMRGGSALPTTPLD